MERRSTPGRGDAVDKSNEQLLNVMVILLVLVMLGGLLALALVMLRRLQLRRQMRGDTLPQYRDVKRSSNHRRLTIQTSGLDGGRSSVLVFRDGQPMLANPRAPPHSPDNVPEIHITFPEESDDQGRRQSGRVVVVRVGDSTVGMEPLHDEQLPAYEKESSHPFYAVDMAQLGGLKEKEYC